MQQSVPHDLKEIDRKILVALAAGNNVPSNLAEQFDVSRQWISQRLQQMESADYVRNIGRGVYELRTENIPHADRETLGLENRPTQAEPNIDRVRVRRHLEAALAAAERGDRNELATRLQQALEELEDDA